MQGVYICSLKGKSKKWDWFQGTVKHTLGTPGTHGDLQLKATWQPLLEWGEKATTSNFEVWDDRPFPECPPQLRISENEMARGTVWTEDILEAWLKEPDTPEEQ